eukprot:TRINITY_DN10973_c0_g1_i1.p1 TRINITY_DN10973_c0_g1~~TRINITY_DN10973_c0_g1_i1.p1  ORF type:complete len:355 (-),score=38.38 TRINITY_DN10973_c0_g1_i1:35-1099(-)
MSPSSPCSSIFTRWAHTHCYCEAGTFYRWSTEPVPVSAHRLLQEDDAAQQRELCSGEVTELWWTLFHLQNIVTAVALSLLVMLCARRLWLLGRIGARRSMRMLHVFCIAALFLRLAYLAAADISMVRSSAWERFAEASYSSFFPLCASAFLCMCMYWDRLINTIEDVPEGPRRWNPLYISCVFVLALDLLHFLGHMWVHDMLVDKVYFGWGCVVSMVVAFTGLRITYQLYTHLRVWLADDSFELSRTVLLSSAAVSMLTVLILALNIVQFCFGRFFAWPYLICLTVGRFLEVVYISLIVTASGRVQLQENNHTRESVMELQEGGSFTDVPMPSGMLHFGLSGPEPKRYARDVSF